MKRFISVLLVIALLVPMLCVDVFAANKTVNNFADLKDAIADAENGDVITVASNITLDKTLAIENKNITIKGSGKISADNALTTVETRKNTLFVINNSTVKFNGLDENQKLTLDGDLKNRIIYSENSTIELTNAVVTKGYPGDNSNINPGGGVFLRGGSLTATNTDFIGNTPGTNDDKSLPEGDRDLNGGAIYTGKESADITITGGSFVDNDVKAYGHGAAIYQENGTLNVSGTSFKNNKGHTEGGNAGTQGACIHTREGVTATITKVTAEIANGFNTGGFLRSLGSDVTVTNSEFKIENLGDGYGYSGGALCFQNGTSEVKGSTFTCNGSKLYHAGGFIDIVGTGTHVIDNNTMTGAGKENGQQIASFGGAISVEEGASATVTITNNTIKDTSASDNGGAIAIGTHKGKDTPANVTMSGNKISNTGTLFWGAQNGGGVFIGPGATVTMSNDTMSDTRASYGGGIYNEGKLTITGGSSLTGGVGSKLGGEIYNNGVLTVDDATITGNFVGPANWNQTPGHGKGNEYGGINIYAEKDVTITPKANITTGKDVTITPKANITTGKDVRVIDGKSKIILTGTLTNQIDVSICEVPVVSSDPKVQPFEDVKRKVGYLVAAGDGTYTPTAEDAKQIHYVSKDTSQAIADFSDQESTGKWDFVLNPKTKQVVLGQRVKLILDANGKTETPAKFEGVTAGRNEDEGILTKLPSEDKKEDIYDIYTEGEKSAILDPEPIRKGYAFTGWYKEAKVNDDAADENKSGKTKVTDQKLVEGAGEITSIIDPPEYELYAGWEKVILVEKVWDDNKDEFGNRPDSVTVKLFKGRTQVASPIELNAQNNWKGEFRNIRQSKYTTAYTVKEDPEQYTGYEVGVVTGNDTDGFTVTNKTEYTTVEGKKTWVHDGNTGTQPTEVTVNLFEDGKATNKSQTGASWKFEKLPKYKNKTLVNYTLTEAPIDHYTSTKSADGYSFTNTFTNKYKATYEFKSGTDGKTLPAAIEGYKPTDDAEYADGATVNAKQPTQTSYEDTENNGTWSFTSWDANSKTIDKADVKFVGTWTFAAKPQTKYKATYEFKSGTDGKDLPAAIEGFKPTDITEYADGATVNAKQPTQTSYEDTENNGTWTFTSWDENSKTIDKADVKFVGTWTFAATPQTKYKATYEFKSGTDGKTLPAAIEGYKPTDDAEYADGATVNAKQPTQTSYEVEDGTWTFNSWDENSKTINKADVKFIGTWTFAAKPEPKSDFIITKSVDKATYKKAGEVLNYTVTVKNTGEADLKDLKLSDSLIKDEELKKLGLETTFNLKVKESKEFKYSYTITVDDVKLKSVTNTASVKIGEDGKPKEAKATSILKEKEKRGDVYVRYETEDGKILDEFAVLIDAPVGTYYYTEEKAFPRYRFVGLAPYSNPAEGYVVEGTQYVVYLYRRDRGGRTPDRKDRYEREEKEVEEPIVEAKRKPELNKKDHKQYMYGYPDWTFVPAANITRGEAAAMFARLFKEYPGLDYNYKKYYTDVDESYWGFKEVAYLSEFGILSGYSDGTFRPNNKITRAEFVKIAESFEALTWGLSPYNDVDGGHWAFRYIVSSAAKGWISGYPDGTFRPNSFISRAEAVTIVNRLLERRPDKDYIDTHKPELKPFTDLKPSYWAYYEIYEAVEGHDYNRSFTDIEEHWFRLNNERFVFSQPRYYR